MPNFKLSARSRKNLTGVHPELVRLVEAAIAVTPVDFAVIEGLRTPERQKEMVAIGASRTLNGRHITGHAVDLMAIVDGKGRWEWPYYEQIARAMKAEAGKLGIAITWGGDWKMRDGPHFELNRNRYPA